MLSLPAIQDFRLAAQLQRLDRFSRFISEIAPAIVAGNDDFESVWSIDNRVYEQHCSPKVRFMPNSGLDQSRDTALSA